MWLITTLISAIVATIFWRLSPGKYQLGFLSLMLWGATVMILVDQVFAYINGEKVLEITTEGMVRSGIGLGLLMLLPILGIWLGRLFFTRLVNRERRG